MRRRRSIGMPQHLEQSRVVFGEDQMLYVVLFEDNPSLGTDVRRQHMPAHLSFLEKTRSGSKRPDPCAQHRASLPAGYGLLKQKAQM